MLDEIRKLIGEVLGIASADVINAREALLEEQASEDARYAATTALLHPEGSTTPLSETHYRAQQRLAKIRKQAEKVLPEAISLLVALEIATQRREEAERHLGQAWKSGAARLSDGLSEAAREWFARLALHGVHPHYLKQHSNETVAILADLIIWKAKDAKFQNADNPWRDVLSIYASRKIDRPHSGGRKGASVPGTPEPDRHNMGMGDYRFDEMVSAAWDLPPRDLATAPAPPSVVSARPFFDCSIYPAEPPAVPDITEVVVADAAPKPEVEPIPVDHPATAPGGEPQLEIVAAANDYALPAHMSSVAIVAILRARAEKLLEQDYERWESDLTRSLGYKGWAQSDEELIAKIEQAPPVERGTPFHCFLDVARLEGAIAGRDAYREATIRRLMLWLATSKDTQEWRDRHGLE